MAVARPHSRDQRGTSAGPSAADPTRDGGDIEHTRSRIEAPQGVALHTMTTAQGYYVDKSWEPLVSIRGPWQMLTG
jgi:hypothetical protein